MRKNVRRRRADSSDEDDEDDSKDVNKKNLAELRKEQQQRKIKLGVQAACTFLDVNESEKKTKKTEEDDEEAEREKQRSIGEMMESSFTGMRYIKKDDTNIHETIMEQYINEKLGVKKNETEEDLPSNKISRREKLLQITQEIQGPAQSPEKSGDGSGIGEGAPIAYSTGIALVDLPTEYKRKNIEETERARRELEQKARGKMRRKPEEPIGNLTTNYHKHRKDYAIDMSRRDPPSSQQQQQQQQFQHGSKQQQPRMSDNDVYTRFKKRTRK